MTKRVRIEAFPGMRINERDLALLRELAGRAGGHGSAVVGSVAMARALGCCAGTALERERLIEVFERFQANGGQAEDEYRITPAGREVLEHAG